MVVPLLTVSWIDMNKLALIIIIIMMSNWMEVVPKVSRMMRNMAVA